jgi:hypothetical protein
MVWRSLSLSISSIIFWGPLEEQLGKLATNIKNFKKSAMHIETQTDKGDKVVGNHGKNKNRNNSRDSISRKYSK